MDLKQGRYTFTHNVVLWEIVSFKTFICSIESVIRKGRNFSNFSRKVPRQKKAPHVGTSHQSADCILIADFEKKHDFSLHIAYRKI